MPTWLRPVVLTIGMWTPNSATAPEAQRQGTFHDTSRPGNSNAGHLYGTDLPAESERALIEYLKTQ